MAVSPQAEEFERQMPDLADVLGSDRPIRALVVGGAACDAQGIARLLAGGSDLPFEVRHTRRLSDALECHAREPFDVLLWDAHGSGPDRVDTLETLKTAAARVPLVALAESDDAAHALQTLRIGAQDYLVRSEIGAAPLARALRHAIERHRLFQKLQRAGQQARFLASHDGLTGLSNRNAFQVLLARALSLAERRQSRLAVLFLDLDGFKPINDTLGHSVGYELIRQVAGRLSERVRKSDVLARLGGDEFVVMLQDTNDDRAPGKVAQTLLEILAEPYELGGREYWITASIGIAEFPRDGSNQDSLIRYADAAMYKAKSLGRNNCQFYSQAMGSAAVRRLDLERKLRRAVEDQALEVHYQPIVDLEARAVVGAEALLRWTDPALGEMPASDIVSLAEETGLIQPIGSWVLETACRDAMAWQREGSLCG